MLELLHKSLSLNKIDAIIIPDADPHGSEYISDHWKVRSWISGFTGSAGTAVITNDHAGVWTDSRYFIQAEKELNKPFELHRLLTKGPEYIDWIIKSLDNGSTVGVDFNLFPCLIMENLISALATKNINVKDCGNIFDEVWQERPPLPIANIDRHDIEYSGESIASKIDRIRLNIKKTGAKQILISALDDIAWTLNLRGDEIKYNPVFTAYLVIDSKEILFFVNDTKLSDQARTALELLNIKILPYNESPNTANYIGTSINMVVDKGNLNYKLFTQLKANGEITHANSIVANLKCIKNNTEIDNYKTAQKRDGLAMVNFLNWIEQRIEDSTITELDLAKKSSQFRAIHPNFKGLSFGTISAYGENAALPHYSVSEESNKTLENKGLYLVDSGAQYIDGTTDITRTISLGENTEEEKIDYTLVLKGHIKLAMARFPIGTKGYQLDTLARTDMWNYGKNFGHGTGHGVGFYLNVHEGPQGIAPAADGNAGNEIKAGMLVTNEPGLYVEGSHGIRTENVLLCIEDENHNGFLRFETLTYCPIDKSPIIKSMLSEVETNWLNDYHETVYNLLAPVVCQSVKQWLREKTLPL